MNRQAARQQYLSEQGQRPSKTLLAAVWGGLLIGSWTLVWLLLQAAMWVGGIIGRAIWGGG